MLFIVLSVMLIASGEGSTLGEADNCDPSELNVCVQKIPKTPVGLPKTKEELDTHCRPLCRACMEAEDTATHIILECPGVANYRAKYLGSPRTLQEVIGNVKGLLGFLQELGWQEAYNLGMGCMDAWIRRCLPTDGQRLVQQQIGGARAIMRFLCANETTALRREFLKEQNCWARVSPEWSSCVNELQSAARDISESAQLFTYFNRNGELCCARDDFISCVTHVGRLCSASAGNLLRRMAWVLAQDVAACNQPRAYCRAPATAVSAPILTALSTILFYPHRI